MSLLPHVKTSDDLVPIITLLTPSILTYELKIRGKEPKHFIKDRINQLSLILYEEQTIPKLSLNFYKSLDEDIAECEILITKFEKELKNSQHIFKLGDKLNICILFLKLRINRLVPTTSDENEKIRKIYDSVCEMESEINNTSFEKFNISNRNLDQVDSESDFHSENEQGSYKSFHTPRNKSSIKNLQKSNIKSNQQLYSRHNRESTNKVKPSAEKKCDNRCSCSDDFVNQNNNSFRPIPVHKWDLKFSGQDGLKASDFIIAVRDKSKAYGVDYDALFLAAPELFRDTALQWFRSQCDKFSSWKDVETALIEDFESPTFYEDLIDEINRRKHRQNEKFIVYYSEILSMMQKLKNPLIESEKIRIIVRNLLPQFACYVKVKDCVTLDEVRHTCLTLEPDITRISNESNQTNNKSFATNSFRAFSPFRFQRDNSRNRDNIFVKHQSRLQNFNETRNDNSRFARHPGESKSNERQQAVQFNDHNRSRRVSRDRSYEGSNQLPRSPTPYRERLNSNGTTYADKGVRQLSSPQAN